MTNSSTTSSYDSGTSTSSQATSTDISFTGSLHDNSNTSQIHALELNVRESSSIELLSVTLPSNYWIKQDHNPDQIAFCKMLNSSPVTVTMCVVVCGKIGPGICSFLEEKLNVIF